jgi:hypothetical protein
MKWSSFKPAQVRAGSMLASLEAQLAAVAAAQPGPAASEPGNQL